VTRSKVGSASLYPATVIVEWENALFADAERPVEMLRKLRQQAAEVVHRRASGTFELLVVYDRAEFCGESLAVEMNRWLGSPDEVLQWRLIAADEGGYYRSKDLGAKQASGELLLFLDSDVIPEEHWLERMFSAFDDPSVQIVAGSAYIEPADFIGKVFALTWFFPLRQESRPMESTATFFANNFALRKSLYIAHPFPELHGSSRGSCLLLASELARANISIWRLPGARVAHPAPNGARHLVKRGLAQGRDDVLRERANGIGILRRWLHTVLRLPVRLVLSAWKVVTRFRGVGLKLVAVPAAVLTAWCYYLLCACGELAEHLGLRSIRDIRV
jgi:glycosyltransferase involved in cell wall biosynthesis